MQYHKCWVSQEQRRKNQIRNIKKEQQNNNLGTTYIRNNELARTRNNTNIVQELGTKLRTYDMDLGSKDTVLGKEPKIRTLSM